MFECCSLLFYAGLGEFSVSGFVDNNRLQPNNAILPAVIIPHDLS